MVAPVDWPATLDTHFLALTRDQWITVVLILLAILVVVPLVRAALRPRRWILRLNVEFFFALAVFYLVVLLTLAVLFEVDFYGVKEQLGEVIGNALPIGVPWFGALGAVMISLQGTFLHNESWDRSYNYWHLARPVFGAALAIVAYFIFILILRAAGTPPEWLGTQDAPPVGDLVVYYVLAFLVGYREANFAELVRRATDLVFRPGGLAALPAPAIVFEKEDDDGRRSAVTSLTLEKKVNGDAQGVKVRVTNTGNVALRAPVVVVEQVDPPGEAFSKQDDSVTGHDLAPGSSNTVVVSFDATERRECAAVLKVISTSLPSPAILSLTGIVTAEAPNQTVP